MFDVAQSLAGPLASARASLGDSAAQIARAGTTAGSGRSDRILAEAANRVVFSEALMSAIHARLAEIKNAAHG